MDSRINWKWDKTNSGKGTVWEKTLHDSIHSIWYERTINIPLEWEAQHVVIDFRRIEGDAIVFLNGKQVTAVLHPGGQLDITKYVNFGNKNTLDVFITRNYTGIQRGFEADAVRYQVRKLSASALPVSQWPMGITAQVDVISRPAQAITDVFCLPSFRKKTFTLEIEVVSNSEQTGDILEAEILDQENQPVLKLKSDPLTLINGKATFRISAPWADAIYWELEKPYLYKARVAIIRQGKQLGQYKEATFGFREIWTEGKELMMNGHPSHWRLTDLYGANKNGLSFYRLIGYNVGQVQPASSLWWGANQDTPLMDEEMLNEMDKIGMGCTLPAPSVVILRSAMLTNKQVRDDYKAEAEYYMKHYRNHPCVLGWAVSMNSANPKLNIWPQGMGHRDSTTNTMQQKVIELACEIVKQIDPTRLAFSHADGSIGDISTANVYLNFVPLQEREDWPMQWAKSGNMPYSAVEFGPPYWNNFWKGNQLLLTEYLSMYLGDDAYKSEQESGLKNTISLSSLTNRDVWGQMDFTQFPAFWKFQSLFTGNTNKAWRTWGVNAGWLQWVLEGYGTPPGRTNRFTERYKLDAPITKDPEWANPRFHIFKQGNQPLLVYLAGAPVHTDKTHTYYSGEKFQKQIAAIWDGTGQKELIAEWALKQGDQTIQQGRSEISLSAGQIKLQPINLTASAVAQRTETQLFLTVMEGKQRVAADTLPITIFPNLKPLPVNTRIAMFDPVGKTTTWVKQLAVQTSAWSKNNNPANVLIIGREALKPGDTMPYTEQDIANGLHVIIMEQKPEVWKGLGFETTETMPRYTYIRDRQSPLLKGMLAKDMVNWRGSPDLLPEGKPALDYDMLHAPKWTNTHSVASVALKTPETAGFTPILQTEFDMAYSPLLEWRYGKGKVTYCTLDLSGRIGTDPVATLLAKNLLQAQSTSFTAQNNVYYAGNNKGLKLISNLGIVAIQATPVNSHAVWVIGADANVSSATLTQFTTKGGTVLHLPQTMAQLSAQGFKVAESALVKVKCDEAPLLRGIGPNMLRWRDVLNTSTFAATGQPAGCSVYNDGIILEQMIGAGKQIYLQVSPEMLENRYPDSPGKTEAIQLSVIRLNQFIAQLLTNLGAHPAKEVAQRLGIVSMPSQFQTLGSWKVLGPYLDNTSDQKKALDTPYPGEQDAIDGGENPNLTYKRKDGVLLDWRKTVNANPDGFIDLSKAFNGIDENAIAYVTKNINSQFSQTATLRLGVDFWMTAWVNGKQVLQVVKNHSKRPNEYILNVPLRRGDNIITLKVVSGKGGFGFWANLAYDQNKPVHAVSTQVQEVSFYSPLYKFFDPYQFVYW